ncbi:uncharacterized protein STEHIDRAFT_146763 [Stereum hirsutum FP-91666 SS1]|uniref:uncharacterized protein n=1 Tax=Stereum hirsutum (strain FP-91666) TaxID=721885 RepID=UPI000440F350|nr:uncharacterized protein STEHIDRAFT_146763 [Stereum hirsutum FP-91666 SS1]EIM87354.1 hypothetical protein STEHIDRAFT_146763 [Stereum hirsutum FP-91666 SS1]
MAEAGADVGGCCAVFCISIWQPFCNMVPFGSKCGTCGPCGCFDKSFAREDSFDEGGDERRPAPTVDSQPTESKSMAQAG